MTRLPHESWNVKASDGPKYRVEPKCANPRCGRLADHAHHIWRRSFVVGDVAWVELSFMEPPLVVQNKCGLCFECHERVTTGEATIRWHADTTRFIYHDEAWDRPTVAFGLPLNPQPAHLGAATVSPAPNHGEHDSAEVCPTCRRPKRKQAVLPPGEKRKRKSWNLTVPDDAEDGAEVLDVLCEELSELFGHDEYASKLRRYYTVTQAFALVLQHRHLITTEGT